MEDKKIENVNFIQNPLVDGEYEYCTFLNCDFSNADLSGIVFMECEFDECNLSMAKLVKTTLRDIRFKNCKMLGMHFENCNEFGLAVSFDNCNLSDSSFYKTVIKKTNFRNS